MASVIDICNTAIGHIGETANVSSIDPPEDSAYAERCARFYPLARDVTLESFNWSFARKRKALSALADNASGYEYAYQLPSDCLKPRHLLPEDFTKEHEQGESREYYIEGDILYSDEASPTLIYTYRQTLTAKYSPLCVEAIAFRLAAYLAGTVVKDEAMQRRLLNDWRLALSMGAQSNANVGKNDHRPEPSWIVARR